MDGHYYNEVIYVIRKGAPIHGSWRMVDNKLNVDDVP